MGLMELGLYGLVLVLDPVVSIALTVAVVTTASAYYHTPTAVRLAFGVGLIGALYSGGILGWQSLFLMVLAVVVGVVTQQFAWRNIVWVSGMSLLGAMAWWGLNHEALEWQRLGWQLLVTMCLWYGFGLVGGEKGIYLRKK